tara:strand:- start:82 stop:537 length:456 start_codon:yes stop_codon:yes gene_type:complete
MTVQKWTNFSEDKFLDSTLLNLFADLDHSYFEWPWLTQDWIDLTAGQRKFLIVWISDEALALWELDNHPHAYLLKIMTKDSSRRKGLAGLIMNQSVIELKRLGFEDALLEVQIDNHKAISFYNKHLWQPSRVIKAFYANGQDAQSMTLKIC